MEGLNYHHLFYFYTVARCGTISKASEELHLTQPTISEQIRLLEKSLGSKLFARSGRNLVLTESGKTVFSFAEKIFTMGQELKESLHGNRSQGRPPNRLKVGISKGIHSILSYRLLKPVMSMGGLRSSQQDHLDALVAKLASDELDIVLSELPVPRSVNANVVAHKISECSVSFLASDAIATKLRSNFPNSLNRAPVLLPTDAIRLRFSLGHWFRSVGVEPEIASECDDGILLALLCKRGAGVITVPSAIEKDISREYDLKLVGRTEAIKEHVYLISRERKLRNPAAVAISNYGREHLLG